MKRIFRCTVRAKHYSWYGFWIKMSVCMNKVSILNAHLTKFKTKFSKISSKLRVHRNKHLDSTTFHPNEGSFVLRIQNNFYTPKKLLSCGCSIKINTIECHQTLLLLFWIELYYSSNLINIWTNLLFLVTICLNG